MDVTFRLKKSLRNLFIGGIVAGLAVPFCFVMSILFDKQPPQPLTNGDVWTVALFPLISIVSIVLLVAYRRSSIELSGQGTLQINVPFIKRSIDLPNVSSAKWDPGVRAVYLIGADHKTKVLFDYIEPFSRLELIQSLRAFAPVDRQDGWPLFCRRIALPLRKKYRLDEPLEAGEWRPKDRRSDAIFGLSTVLGFLLAGALAIACSLPRLILYPFILLAVWPFVRRWESPGQTVFNKSEIRYGHLAMTTIFGISGMTFVAIGIIRWLGLPHEGWLFSGVTAINFLVLALIASRLDHSKRGTEQDGSAAAAERWEALERGLAE